MDRDKTTGSPPMDRRTRLDLLCPDYGGPVAQQDLASCDQQLYAVVCSRLGRNLEQRRRTFAYLTRAALKAKSDRAKLLIVAGTAVDPWLRRCCQLLQLDAVVLDAVPQSHRDPLTIALAERVYGIWVRRGGRIARLLAERVQVVDDQSTWVACNDDPQCAAKDLIHHGAVGWYLQTQDQRPLARLQRQPDRRAHGCGRVADSDTQIDWNQYLVHCTRGRSGALPGQSQQQYLDEILLGGDGSLPADAWQTLLQIVQSGWLLGGHRTTTGHVPVVCFSRVPLPELLRRRCFRKHLGRWDYEPWGIAIERSAAQRFGCQPVVYDDTNQRKRLPEEQQWRFQAAGKGGAWRDEQEWRSRGSFPLHQLSSAQALIFVGHPDAVDTFAAISRWPIVDASGLV